MVCHRLEGSLVRVMGLQFKVTDNFISSGILISGFLFNTIQF